MVGNSNFDQPTLGDVNSTKPALEIKNAGNGRALEATAVHSDAIVARALDTGSIAIRARGDGGGVQASSQTGTGVYGHSRSAAGVFGESADADGVHGVTKGGGSASGVAGESYEPGSVAVRATSDRGIGVLATSNEAVGVSAVSKLDNGVLGEAEQSGRAGVWGVNIAPGGIGVVGLSQIDFDLEVKGEPQMSIGVFGQARDGGTGVRGEARDGDGVVGATESAGNSGVVGRNGASHGRAISGLGDQGTGVFASSGSSTDPALLAQHDAGGHGISATTSGTEPKSAVRARNEGDGFGLLGSSAQGRGVVGLAGGEGLSFVTSLFGEAGVVGVSFTGPAVGAFGGTGQIGVEAWGDPAVFAFGGIAALPGPKGDAGFFLGKVAIAGDLKIIGNLSATGFKAFQIDHPLDPAKRYLNHAAVESSELKTVYDGVVKLDAEGRASVTLPDWFAAINGDLRYQLTPIGGPAPDLHVAKASDGKTVEIAGGRPGLEVCWQVTGVRHDASAEASHFVVEEKKPKGETGTYLQPELFGEPASTALRSTMLPDRPDLQGTRDRMLKAVRKA